MPYRETGYFTDLVNDYLEGHDDTLPFFKFRPDLNGIASAVGERYKYPINRPLLVDALIRQYANTGIHEKTSTNIGLLLNENTFTICTAHQPNLLTGYLYFIYKILHAIKMAEQLSARYPDKNFVPVYYMGSEDNDIDELGRFKFRTDKFIWDGSGQKGAVGRMNTTGLRPLLQELFKVFGPPGPNCNGLEQLITNAYLKHGTISEATHFLVNELFGRFGLVILNPDDAALKSCFIPVMKDELLNEQALPIVSEQTALIGKKYKTQAYPRPINLFYLNDQLRERIEKNGAKWRVLNTGIEWDENTLLEELNNHPERFSPNVILRGLYQETILPNVVFIGGGAEVSYWFQLKPLFEHYQVFYPCIYLRQSIQWVNTSAAKLRKDLGFSIPEIFKSETELGRQYVLQNGKDDFEINNEIAETELILATLKHKAEVIDVTLGPATMAVMARIRRQLEILQKKMLKAEKNKMQVHINRIAKLKTELFPGNNLQERTENFCDYYLQSGQSFFDIIYESIKPFDPGFLVIE